MSFITIATFANYFETVPVIGRLESEGITCFLRDEHSATINPILNNSIGGIKLDINEKDYETAKSILAEMGHKLSEAEETPVPLIIQKIDSFINNIPHIQGISRFVRSFLLFALVALAILGLLFFLFPMVFWGISRI